MELTLIFAGLLAAVAGLAVAVAWAARAVAGHRHDLAAAGKRAASCSPVRRFLAGCEPLAVRIRSRVAPGWFFSVTAALGPARRWAPGSLARTHRIPRCRCCGG